MNIRSIARLGAMILPIFLLFLIVSGGLFLYFKNPQFKSWLENNPLAQNQAEKEAKVLGAQVSKLVYIPEDEVPTILTVSDVTKLRNQDFYKNAKNGDKVLIFLKARKAILYDPELKKILEIGPLNLSQETPTPNTGGSQTIQARVALKNGTSVAGLAVKAESELMKTFPDITIVSKDQTKSPTYDKTIVVVLNPKGKSTAEQLARFYGVTIGEFPPEEVVPDGADILVILGKDRAPAAK